jgi:hypothetical protein
MSKRKVYYDIRCKVRYASRRGVCWSVVNWQEEGSLTCLLLKKEMFNMLIMTHRREVYIRQYKGRYKIVIMTIADLFIMTIEGKVLDNIISFDNTHLRIGRMFHLRSLRSVSAFSKLHRERILIIASLLWQ